MYAQVHSNVDIYMRSMAHGTNKHDAATSVKKLKFSEVEEKKMLEKEARGRNRPLPPLENLFF